MKISKPHLLWFITFLLIGCSTQQTLIISPSGVSTTQTPIPPLPTFNVAQAPTSTILPTKSPLPTPTATPKIPFTLNRLRMVIVKDGNLYLQNGTNPLIQLTYSGKDRDPIISDDGEKIIFYRGEAFDNVYSINADGSQEQVIIVSQSLPVLGRGDIKSLTFIPNTHQLLFNTYLCNAGHPLSYNAPDCAVGIYHVDVDSRETNELISGLSGNGTQTQKSDFEISPDGHAISIASSGHIDVYSLSIEQISVYQQNAIVYTRTIPDEFIPPQHWLLDSRELIAILPAEPYNEPTTPPQIYTIWRYNLDEKSATQIPLAPPINWNSGCDFSISPDRNWIFYISKGNSGMPDLYLGNLNDNHTSSYDWEVGCPSSYAAYPQWSPDSQYFALQSTINTIDGISISINGDFRGWLDSNHFFYVTIEENGAPIYIGEIGGKNITLPESFQWSPTYVLLNQ